MRLWRKPKKRHLTYNSLSEWLIAESIPQNWLSHPDIQLRDKWIDEYGELRQHLFKQHQEKLPLEERLLFENKTHPSSSHRFEKEALPYLDTLRLELDRIGVRYTECCLGFYHCDRLILSVTLADDEHSKTEELPWLHRGFEVKYG